MLKYVGSIFCTEALLFFRKSSFLEVEIGRTCVMVTDNSTTPQVKKLRNRLSFPECYPKHGLFLLESDAHYKQN